MENKAFTMRTRDGLGLLVLSAIESIPKFLFLINCLELCHSQRVSDLKGMQ